MSELSALPVSLAVNSLCHVDNPRNAINITLLIDDLKTHPNRRVAVKTILAR